VAETECLEHINNLLRDLAVDVAGKLLGSGEDDELIILKLDSVISRLVTLSVKTHVLTASHSPEEYQRAGRQ
jgi:hypothetical protein